MTRDDIIRLAQEAGFDVEVQDMFNYKPQHSFIGSDENIERFATLVAEAEREALLKEGEKLIKTFLSSRYSANQPASSFQERFAIDSYMQAIRARGESK